MGVTICLLVDLTSQNFKKTGRNNMDFINIVKRRYSVRSYMDKKVEADKLEKILEVVVKRNSTLYVSV